MPMLIPLLLACFPDDTATTATTPGTTTATATGTTTGSTGTTPGPTGTTTPTGSTTSGTGGSTGTTATTPPCLDDDGDGFTTCDGDCADDDPAVNPGAVETCDGIDNDCSGAADDRPDPGGGYALCCYNLYEGTAYAGLGFWNAPVGDQTGDGLPDIAMSDLVTTWIVSPLPYGTWKPAKVSSASIGMYGIVSSGDVNGDGWPDVLVGNSLFSGPLSGSVDPSSATAVFDGYTYLSTIPGDMDGDGYDDVAMWLSYEDMVYVVPGPLSGPIYLPGVGWNFGGDGEIPYAIEGGDLDGDGLADLLVTTWNTPHNTGVVRVLLGSSLSAWPPHSTIPFGMADVSIMGDDGSDFGLAVALAGDLTGDGVVDLVAGDATYPGGAGGYGAAYVFSGADLLALPPGSVVDTSLAYAVIEAGADNVGLGTGVDGVGDFNGDGHGDLVVGDPYWNDGSVSSDGTAYLFLGPLPAGAIPVAAADARLTDVYTGIGYRVDRLGDVDGDGLDDVLVGDLGLDYALQPMEGAACLVRGF